MLKKNLIYSLLFHSILGIVLYFSLRSMEYGGQFEFSLDSDEVAVEFREIASVPVEAIEEKIKEEIKPEKAKEEIKKEEKLEEVAKVEEKIVPEDKIIPEEKIIEEREIEVEKEEIKPAPVPVTAPAPVPVTAPTPVPITEEKDETKEELDKFKNDFGDESVSFSGFYSDEDSASNLADLSSREKLIFLDQIKVCKKRAEKITNYDGKKNVEIIVEVNKDGFFNIDNIVVVDEEKFVNIDEEEDFKKAVNNAKQTLRECNPLRNMPEEKHYIWKKMKLNFNSVGGED